MPSVGPSAGLSSFPGGVTREILIPEMSESHQCSSKTMTTSFFIYYQDWGTEYQGAPEGMAWCPYLSLLAPTGSQLPDPLL